MRDRVLGSQMARATQCDKVPGLVGNVGYQVFAPTVDMVDIKRSPIAAFGSANSACFIPVQHGETNSFPMSPELEAAATPIVWMGRADCGSLRASVRAEAPIAPCLTGKGPKWLLAVLTSQSLSGDQVFVATGERAVPDLQYALTVKHRPAFCARYWRHRVGETVCALAGNATKFKHRVLFHNVARALKFLSAMGATKRGAIDHRSRVASLAAKDRLGIIGLKFSSALGARLEH